MADRTVRVAYYSIEDGTCTLPADATVIAVDMQTWRGLEQDRRPCGLWVLVTVASDELAPPLTDDYKRARGAVPGTLPAEEAIRRAREG
jgi:hypothetical protein